jgi:hypothetical protein
MNKILKNIPAPQRDWLTKIPWHQLEPNDCIEFDLAALGNVKSARVELYTMAIQNGFRIATAVVGSKLRMWRKPAAQEEEAHDVSDYMATLDQLIERTGLDGNTIVGMALLDWAARHHI